MKKIFISAIISIFTHTALASDDSITPPVANAKANSGEVIIVDVREESEIRESGMAKPAEWLATSEINSQGPAYNAAVARWSKSKPIVFYCRSGNRSGKALHVFQSLGFKGFNMGAFQGWKDAGLPVRATP